MEYDHIIMYDDYPVWVTDNTTKEVANIWKNKLTNLSLQTLMLYYGGQSEKSSVS